MIKNFKQYNEGIKHLLVGPTKEDIWTDLMNGKLKGLLKSIPTSPEDFFNQIKEGCVEMGENEYGIYFGKNGTKVFHEGLKNNILWIRYNVWSILEKIYEFDKSKIRKLIKNSLKNTKWRNFTPELSSGYVGF
jgi:hypothetical protein